MPRSSRALLKRSHCRRLTLSRTDRTRSWMLRTPRWGRGSASRGSARRGRRSLACRRQLAPKILEPVGRHFGVAHRVLDVLVPDVMLQGPRVMAIVSELEPTGMAKHVWMDREWHLGSLAHALDEAVEANRANWSAALGNEDVSVPGVVAA